MLKFSEIFEFSKEKFRKIPILKEFEWFEWFEWFGPSPIEPFNSVSDRSSGMVGDGHPQEARENPPGGQEPLVHKSGTKNMSLEQIWLLVLQL